MSSKIPKLSLNAYKELELCKITPTVDEIIEIYELGKKAQEYVHDSKLLMMAFKEVGNVRIYPLTLGARIFIEEIVKDWFADNETMISLALVYSFAHSREPDKFIFDSQDDARIKITNWARAVNVTQTEIERAIFEFAIDEKIPPMKEDPEFLLKKLVNKIEKDEKVDLAEYKSYLSKEDSDDDTSVIPLLSYLMRQYPQLTEEDILWNTPDEMLYKLMVEAKKEDSKGKTEFVNPKDKSIIAFQRLKVLVNDIKKLRGTQDAK
jgi:hypothetical protein